MRKHPFIHIYVPDTLLIPSSSSSSSPCSSPSSTNPQKIRKILGFVQRRTDSVVLVSLVKLEEEGDRGGDDEYDLVGTLIYDTDAPSVKPSVTWTQPGPSSCFIHITFRLVSPSFSSSSSLAVDGVVFDGVLLPPDPSSLYIFNYDPNLLEKCSYLRTLPETRSGLAEIVKKSCRQYRNEEKDEDEFFGPVFPAMFESLDESDFIKKNVNRSLGVKQFRLRMQLTLNLIQRRFPPLNAANFLVLLIMDIAVGIYVSQFLQRFPYLYSLLHTQVDHLLQFLLRLLQWLSGSPAGLKLNFALNSLLSRFFAYHLHLWANYIGILEPMLSFVLSLIIHIGPLGFTLQLSLIKDLLSIGTFHIYCLYIYATRLYRVIMVSIQSLGRMFMGRKWNPLRVRVDHATLTVSEIFLGALFFTIAIFLAPTVIVYYFVFLFLRLPVLLLEAFLLYIVSCINHLRLATVAVTKMNWAPVCDQIYLEMMDEDSRPLRFRIKVQAMKSALMMKKPPSPFPNGFMETVKAAIRGEVLGK